MIPSLLTEAKNNKLNIELLEIEESGAFSCTEILCNFIKFFIRAEEEPVPLSSFKFEVIPREILDIIANNAGPSVLMLAGTCKIYKQNLEKHVNLLRYRQGIRLLNETRKISPNFNNKVKHDISNALILVDPKRSLKLTGSMNNEDFGYKCRGLNAVAETYPMLELLDRAVKASSHVRNDSLPYKCDVLIPVIKILGILDSQKMLKTANEALENITTCNPYQACKAIAALAKILRTIHPERALEIINDTIEDLEKRHLEYFEESKALAHLLPILALFDVGSALKKLPGAESIRHEILIAIADELAVDNPVKALEILNNAFRNGPPRGFKNLIAYAKALNLCHEHEKAKKMRDLAIKRALSSSDFIEIATVLASYDPESAITQLQTAFSEALEERSFVARAQNIKNIFQLLIDLNDKTMIMEYAEVAYKQIKFLYNVDVYKDEAFSVISIAYAPYNLERAKKMARAIKDPVCQACTRAKMARRIFKAEDL